MMNFLDIRSANAAGAHAEEHFAFADLRDRHGLDHDAPFAAVHSGAHVSVSLSFGAVRC